MLEVVIPGIRHGEGKMMSSTCYRGCHAFIAGVDADGYQLLRIPQSTTEAVRAVFPVNKYYFSEDLNDTSDAVDKFTSGDTCIYYEGGEYITDKFNHDSLGLDATYWNDVETLPTAPAIGGRKAYVPGSSTAIGTVGMRKLYVSTGSVAGYLTATPAGFTAMISTAGYVGISIQIYYTDSSDAKLRYRIISPGRERINDIYTT